ncbi:PREDICTED: 3 beta-hydroxysteroid dehydrogenase type 7-like [Branchiostoma belcheri]|uniref:3 beta-hydroxysteroid dehydrogenase type 7-like n=1 Tax=Branchiostoma belcheri TaxID=7741 RepID=A0A6P4ZUM7_BRABE|nr:PREDICTED: 3 beta-hydroxysteroid dehydrogenase type 7-like [Branchiostoma belcheri]
MPAGLTYVVTGGCGFVGSHIVDLLVQRGRNISEIRVVDTQPRTYGKSPEKTGVKVKLIRGDVTNMAQMTEVCAGADVVIHTAALIDVYGFVSDVTLWDVNVKGTETLLQCCVNEDVTCFVYTSSREAVGPKQRGDPVEDGDESTPYDSSSPVLFYSRTKAAAESAVLRWNGRRTNGGKTLHTCALRPSGIYGDGEMATFKIWREIGLNPFAGPHRLISHPKVKCSCAYVGNVAWAHLLAAQTLLTSPSNAGGEAFFIADDTPVGNEMATYSNIFAPVGIRWDDSLVLPLWVLYFIAYILAFLRFLLKPFYNFVPRLTPAVLTLVNTTFCVNYKKAARLLGYKPLFTWEESKRKTREALMEWKAREFSSGHTK